MRVLWRTSREQAWVTRAKVRIVNRHAAAENAFIAAQGTPNWKPSCTVGHPDRRNENPKNESEPQDLHRGRGIRNNEVMLPSRPSRFCGWGQSRN
jgi:hypothetical protein